MKRFLVITLAAILVSSLLTGCVQLKPFTQEDLDRLSYVAE